MFTNFLSLLAFGAVTFSTGSAALVGDAAAVAACQGFQPGVIKCLSDVSFVVCRGGGLEVEQFVAPGTHCEQGIPYQRKDSVNAEGIATTTRIYVQNPPEITAAPPAALTTSVPPPSPAAAPPSTSADPPAPVSNSISVVSGSATTFATASSV